MNEREFLIVLKARAQEQKKAMHAVPFPTVFAFVVEWLSHHPWRFLIPLAFLLSLLIRGIVGPHYTELILRLFRGI